MDGDQRVRVVVGVDHSERSRRALRWAVYLAQPLCGVVDAVLVWRVPPATAPREIRRPVGLMLEQMRSELATTIAESFADGVPDMLREHAILGDPAGMLTDVSRDATMLVVGSGRHHAMAAAVLGSVSAKCVRTSTCPVLVVHDSEPPAYVGGPTAPSLVT